MIRKKMYQSKYNSTGVLLWIAVVNLRQIASIYAKRSNPVKCMSFTGKNRLEQYSCPLSYRAGWEKRKVRYTDEIILMMYFTLNRCGKSTADAAFLTER